MVWFCVKMMLRFEPVLEMGLFAKRFLFILNRNQFKRVLVADFGTVACQNFWKMVNFSPSVLSNCFSPCLVWGWSPVQHFRNFMDM